MNSKNEPVNSMILTLVKTKFSETKVYVVTIEYCGHRVKNF